MRRLNLLKCRSQPAVLIATSLLLFSCGVPLSHQTFSNFLPHGNQPAVPARTPPNNSPPVGNPPASNEIDFNRDVLPILSDRCFACHGPDLHALEADLSLIDLEHATSDRDGDGPALIPGDAMNSLVYERINDAEDPMPPENKGVKPLNDREKEIIKRWIDSGAEYEEHWAFLPVQRPTPPTVNDQAWNQSPIDQFVHTKLSAEGLNPSERADRETLARRAAITLTGLPPTLDELDAFLNDTSTSAYETFVDAMLAKPSYGEHQARYWLDANRYADTHGMHWDSMRGIWPYRDWVVRALNNNMPLDEFVRWQLAGDLLEQPTLEQKLASGFVRLNVSTNEGGTIPEEARANNGFDRVETFGTVFLGMTMACARCHDHKYDPISAQEYYGLKSFLNSTAEKALDGNRASYLPVVHVPADEAGWQTLDKLLDEQNKWLAHYDEDAAKVDAWATSHTPQPLTNLRKLGPLPNPEEDNDTFEKLSGPEDGSTTIGDLIWKPIKNLNGQQKNPVGKNNSHVFIAADISVTRTTTETWNISADDGFVVYVDNEIIFAEPNAKPKKEGVKVAIRLSPGDHTITFKIVNNKGQSRFRLVREDPLMKRLRTQGLAALNEDERKRVIVLKYLPDVLNDPKLTAWLDTFTSFESTLEPSLVAQEDLNAAPTHMLYRGEYNQKREQVDRITITKMGPWPDGAPRNRLGLAEWLLNDSHPLMTRVWVNRLWGRVFGRGLVDTAEDFGLQGDRPSHPQLLDWLASELPRSGWDLKYMLKLMVMSETFRQTSAVKTELLERDPHNELLAYGPRYRLDAEIIRDQALMVAGLLNPKIGGPGVKPYQPSGMWETGYPASNTSKYKQDNGEKLYRRSMYLFHKRTSPHPLMTLFDAPDRQLSCVARDRTDTPLQSLALYNETAYLEAARHLAQRALGEPATDDAARVRIMYRMATCREPSAKELSAAVAFVEQARRRYDATPDDARALLTVGESTRDESIDPIDHAAWMQLSSAILASDRCLTQY